MSAFHPVFSLSGDKASLLEFRIQVLRDLLSEMRKQYLSPDVRVVDYSILDAGAITDIATHFNLTISSSGLIKMQERMNFHSKIPGKVFQPVGGMQVFNHQEMESINKELPAVYNQFSAVVAKFKEASYVE